MKGKVKDRENDFAVQMGMDEFIEDKLVEYNLSMAPATQGELFE